MHDLMSERALLIGCFGVGVVLQALLLQRGDWQPRKLIACVGLSLVAMLPGKHESVYRPLFHVLMTFSAFAVIFAIRFKEDILPPVGEKLLLSYALIFWFAFFAYFYRPAILQKTLLFLMLIPTVATIVVAYGRIALNFTLKLILYTWFLCMVVGLGLFQFPLYELRLFFQNKELPWVTPLESLSAGMAFLYPAANATYIFYLIPLQGKNETWAERMQRWHAFTDLMTQRFDGNMNIGPIAEVLLIAEAAVLISDYFLHWLPRELIINLLIVLPGVLLFFRRPSNPAAQLDQSEPQTQNGALD